MGTAPQALVALAIALLAADAHADTCTGVTSSGGRFAKCFDLGNRLSVTAGSEGVGGSLRVRHLIRFDDEPDLVWKLEHVVGETTWGAWNRQLDTAVYRGRFLRHARDGKLVLPALGAPKKIFLPFDIGAEATVANVRWRPLQPVEDQLHVEVVNIAGLLDFARARSSQHRFAIGPIVRWDIDVDRSMGRIGKVSEHAVSPFTMGLLNFKMESKDGLWLGEVRAEAGVEWHTQGSWKKQARAEVNLERIVIAINDRPIAITAGASYDTLTEEAMARVGLRVVIKHTNHERVNLNPLREKPTAVPPPKAAPPGPPVLAPPPPPAVDPKPEPAPTLERVEPPPVPAPDPSMQLAIALRI